MTPTRAAAMIVGTALLAAWFASAAGTRLPSPGQAPSSRPATADQPQAGAPRNIHIKADRLRARRERLPAPPQPSRNPFAFATVEPVPADRGPFAASPPVPEDFAWPPEPDFTLVAIAESHTDGGLDRTAVIAGPGDLYFVKEGQEVPGFRVTAIRADAVDLLGVADDRALRLEIR